MHDDFIQVASFEDVKAKGLKTVTLSDKVILLIFHEDKLFALDNRCPHMGFPLARGTVKRGVLTCHWHHARFELCSGGTFDLWADDVRSYPVDVRENEIWLNPNPQRDEAEYQLKRLQAGLEQNIRLLMAKSVMSLLDQQVAVAELLKLAGRFATAQRDAGWRDGLTILSAMTNCLPYLAKEDQALALFHGMLHVANNTENQTPHYALEPLATKDLSIDRLKAWLREFAEVRDRNGVERVVLTAVSAGYSHVELADMFFAALTDYYFLDTGHSLDFVNKAFELLDYVGWDQAATILPSLVSALTNAQRMEESSSWRNPIDLPKLLDAVFDDLLRGKLLLAVNQAELLSLQAFDDLVEVLLSDDPEAIIQSLVTGFTNGIAVTELSLALSFAAAKRVALFHTSNEFSDWIAVLHSFTTANATHQLLKRAPSREGARSIFHTAMHLYLNRFLNMPAARQPTVKTVANLSSNKADLLKGILDLTNARENIEQVAALTYRYLEQQHSSKELIATLAHTLLREDAEFHSYQILEAGVQLFEELKHKRADLAPTVLVAVARYLAGHAPSDRATTQTYRIAARLHAGEALAET